MNLSKIIIALHTINKAKEEVKVLQNCTIKKNIYDKIIHRKDILLQYLIDKKYYSNLDCWVRMKETMELFSAITYIENFILRHKIY